MCLLDAVRVHAEGCPAINTRQVELYYKCLLSVDVHTPPGHPEAFYRKMLKGAAVGDLLALEDAWDEPLALGDDAAQVEASHESDWVGSISADLGINVLTSFAARPPRRRARIEPIALVPHVDVVHVAPVADEVPADPSSTNPAIVVLDRFMPPTPVGRIHGEFIEGVPIIEEIYVDQSHRYVRWKVRCPFGADKHRQGRLEHCCKRRSANARNMARFGISEVYAFLGVWLRKAEPCLDRHAHMIECKPTDAEIEAYCIEKGWVITDA